MLRSVMQPASVPISAVWWTTPTTDFYKLNVNAAGPIRDENGVAAAARCWYMAALPESNVAEGLALLKGMEFAKEMLFLNLKVEADSSNVINEVQPQQSYLGSIIEDSKSFVSSFRSIDFCHIRRKAIQAAHYLAKFAIQECTDFAWVEETPSCISAVVAFDLLPPSF